MQRLFFDARGHTPLTNLQTIIYTEGKNWEGIYQNSDNSFKTIEGKVFKVSEHPILWTYK
jgi:hypothetical protein